MLLWNKIQFNKIGHGILNFLNHIPCEHSYENKRFTCIFHTLPFNALILIVYSLANSEDITARFGTWNLMQATLYFKDIPVGKLYSAKFMKWLQVTLAQNITVVSDVQVGKWIVERGVNFEFINVSAGKPKLTSHKFMSWTSGSL